MDYSQKAQAMTPYMVDCRRFLHQTPELSTDLPKTIEFVCHELESMGISYRVVPEGGIIGSIGKTDGNVFLLRADMDALPVQEQSAESFCSKNGNMHACGHDIHTSMLLGAAKLLKEQESRLEGGVKLVFQCDEEGTTGMATLIENGVLKDPVVNAGMALHVLPGELYAGQYFCASGPVSSAVDRFKITIIGKGAHGATPQKGIDPINVAAHICLALQTIISREICASDTALLSNGFLQAGSAFNVIPSTATLGGTVRSFSPDVGEFIKKRIVEISEHTSKAFNATCQVEFPNSAPSCINDKDVTALVQKCGASVGLSNINLRIPTVSEDFSLLSQQIPCCFVWIGAGGASEKYKGGVLHDEKVCFNEAVMPFGAALLASSATAWLAEHSIQ